MGYRGSHQPDTTDDSPRFHELDKAMPNFYQRPHDYVWHLDDEDHSITKHLHPDQLGGATQAVQQALRARGNPDARVMLYRAVPKGVTEINSGDWVTTSHHYARQHAALDDDPRNDMDVLAKQVRANEITFGGNDAYEFGYVGSTVNGRRLPRSRRQSR
jgi:hypothetical protein